MANPEKEATPPLLQQAARLIARAGRTCWTDASTASLARFPAKVATDVRSLAREVDLILVFGGDGTMLRVTRELGGSPTPILGINVGRLGFLTAVTSTELKQALQKIWDLDYRVERRALIEASGQLKSGPVSLRALNDFVVSRGSASRMIELEVRINGEVLTIYRCDGLIVSSPTGSTAYSLSAGGAIVTPEAEVFTITPICPHTLSNRSVVTELRSRIEVKVISEKLETTLTSDGQVQVEMDTGDIVHIGRSRHFVSLVHPGGNSFFETLRQKLHWSGSNL